MIVTFDFDNTIWCRGFDPSEGIFSRSCGPDPAALSSIRFWFNKGASIHIVTSRVNSNRSEVDDFMMLHGHMIKDVHFTNGVWKSKLLAELGSELHHDDDVEELARLDPRTRGVLWKTGWLDENDNVCDPDDEKFRFDKWV